MNTEHPAVLMPTFFTKVVEHGGAFNRGEWPEHLTLFAPAEGVYDDGIRAGLREVARTAKPFQVMTGKPALFGPARDTIVRLIEPSAQLAALQQKITAVFENLTHDPTYMQPYRPHISAYRRGDELVTPAEGLTLEVGGFSVVQRLGRDAIWQVVDKIRLKGEVDV